MAVALFYASKLENSEFRNEIDFNRIWIQMYHKDLEKQDDLRDCFVLVTVSSHDARSQAHFLTKRLSGRVRYRKKISEEASHGLSDRSRDDYF